MCEALGKCGACAYKDDCKNNYYGTGDPICADFQCVAPDELCDKHFSCISFEEEMEMHGYFD